MRYVFEQEGTHRKWAMLFDGGSPEEKEAYARYVLGRWEHFYGGKFTVRRA